MCHEFEHHAWSRDTEEAPEKEEADGPPFLNDEPAEEVEILTDGGDEDE